MSNTQAIANGASIKGDQKWYQNPFVWLIIGGPLLVVVASFITLYLAITHPDPAIDDYYRKGIEINKTLDAQGQESLSESMAPAIQARNHAQTGLKPAEE
ncbi:FixH family protein [Methylophilus methylotrophus]|uniref:FixH family protein n=1 Tax=Methylophilus methylotrophus TaxID=17 RepID=UPI00037DA379|nr:FixH family protein [Methylophilus methylotrophus]